ncbi:hypothetical protein GV794_01850 [Nocardia cyriacigeorgica]|uniref:Uncharacterized protein n=1 Tax=Nocardia cyriacigeorgica TaxID=135487 RepID=A0ABX0CJ91_9NOCA|nr:hypothetical protein [Nocardia cyriacigeorgica]NEW40768.1 hypothetical protein [Nocardia cyriacigeorgica]NEW51005.1 hypothetical protein [Nocardia cyriacigeorgica]NEW54411.1 hypothetical protein [Nocardia cyriacigeorgica]
MTKVFECISDSGTMVRDFLILPNREELWAALFDVSSWDEAAMLFDLTPAQAAVPVIDAAIARLRTSPDDFRALVAADDPVGLRGNLGVLLSLRKHLIVSGGTISGPMEPE